MSLRIPPLLEPYLVLPPESSQLLLTSVLGASTNWLVLRYLYALLGQPRSSNTFAASTGLDATPCVLLVSFLRDYAFWRDGAARVGVDLEALGRAGRFAYVDGLGDLFTEKRNGGAPGAAPATLSAVGRPGPLPSGRQTPVTVRQPAVPAAVGALPAWHRALSGSSVAEVSSAIQEAINGLVTGTGHNGAAADRKVVLVVDQLDVLLAATEASVSSFRGMMLDLREKVNATILTLAADEPLVSPQTTSLEKEHASFVVSLAHESEIVLSLRLLDTGVAKDVSGVARIACGGQDAGRTVEEREFLYHVGGDGGVRVFERGQ